MDNKKHIDRIFKEKLKNFEAVPDDAIWENIHQQLHEDKRKRRIVPLWWKVAGVAAVLALLFTLATKFITQNAIDPIGNGVNVVNTNNDTNENPDANGNDLKHSLKDADATKTANTSNPNGVIQNTPTEQVVKITVGTATASNGENRFATNAKNENGNSVVSKNHRSKNQNNGDVTISKVEKENAVADGSKTDMNALSDIKTTENQNIKNTSKQIVNPIENQNNVAVTDAFEKLEDILTKEEETIEDAIAKVEEANSNDDVMEKQPNRWNVSPNVSPIYFGSLGKGSSLDEQFINNTKEGAVTMSYGIGGSYAVNTRLKIRAGINKVAMEHATNDVLVFNSIDQSSGAKGTISNLSANANGQHMTYLSEENLNKDATPVIMNSTPNSTISQRLGFVEIPLEVEYALVNKKLAVNAIGGFSALIADRNEIYAVSGGQEMLIGEANNINAMSYSANLGLGVNYNISEKIKLNVEPTFKYQINTFSKSAGDFRPYFIGVYTGFSYKF